MKAKITGVGKAIPPRKITNHDLEKMMNTSDEWIRQRTGIESRYWVEPQMATSDLGLEASLQAIEQAGIKKEDIDMIIFATLSPDHDFPGTGCFLQAKLGLPGIPAIDIRQQCTGFLYGLSIADKFIRCQEAKTILLVGAEIHSKGLDRTPAGRDVSVLFGDGAGACIIQGHEAGINDSQIYKSNLHADGTFAKELWLPGPGNAFDNNERCSKEMIDEGLHYPKMNGKVVFVHAVKRMAETITETIAQSGFKIHDIDLFLFHQANLRINSKVAEILGIDEDKVFNTIMEYGNTTAATIPIGMADAIANGKLKKGMLVASAAFGSGFTWASSVWRQ